MRKVAAIVIVFFQFHDIKSHPGGTGQITIIKSTHKTNKKSNQIKSNQINGAVIQFLLNRVSSLDGSVSKYAQYSSCS
jgi:hypothetical protein